MILGALADSHDHLERIERAVERLAAARVEAVLHAGDFVAPFALQPLARLGCPVYAVLGNNDGERVGLQRTFEALFGAPSDLQPNLLTAELGGRRLAMSHYPEVAEPLASSGDFDLVVFGHTHEQRLERVGETVLFNPGEVCGWLTGRPTIAVVDLARMEVEVVEI